MTITDLGRASAGTKPMPPSPAPSSLHPGQTKNASHRAPAGVDSDFDSGHWSYEAQNHAAAVELTNPAGQTAREAQSSTAGGVHDQGNGQQAKTSTEPTIATLADPLLALAADILDDAEENRKANENRLRQLLRGGPDDPRLQEKNKDGTPKYATCDDLPADKDGEDRGFRLPKSNPDVARLSAQVDMLGQLEHQAVLNLERRLRQHPLGPWVKAQKGVGNKQAARLLAIIGDPYVNIQTGEIRTVSQLWAYCGHGDPSRKVKKGMSQKELFALGNPVAKSRTFLIATACLKAQGYYADVYYERKAKTEGRLHTDACVRCGPSGKPAQPGSPWSDAHRHADALRITGKEILRDLWIEAKRIHETTGSGHISHENQIEAAAAGNNQGRQS